MSTIAIDKQFDLTRGGRDETGYLQNHCNKCDWSGQKHYAYNDYQHSNCKDERSEHRSKCGNVG